MESKPRSHLGLRIFHILLLWLHLGLIVCIILLGAFSIITVGFIIECVLAFFALVWVIPAIWDNDSAWSQIGLDITYVVLQLATQLFVAIWITLTRISTDCYAYYSYSYSYWSDQDYEEAVCNRLVAAYVISYLHSAALFFALIALIVLARRRINAGWGRGVWKMSTARLLKIKSVIPSPLQQQQQQGQGQHSHLPPPPLGLYAPQQQQQYTGYQLAPIVSPIQPTYSYNQQRSSTMSMPTPAPTAASPPSTSEEIRDMEQDHNQRPLPALPQ